MHGLTLILAALASGPEGAQVDLGAEYRTRSFYIRPLDVAGTTSEKMIYTQQRFRLDAELKANPWVSIITQVDALDGVIFGDNGKFGTEPAVNHGISIASMRPNEAGWDVGLMPGGDPLQIEGYGPVLVPIDPVEINRAYGEVKLPIGLLRVGRQPLIEGTSIAASSGDGRESRWGAREFSNTADRFLFGTKPIEIARVVATGDPGVADSSPGRGLFWAAFYDLVTEDLPQLTEDDTSAVGSALIWRQPESEWLAPWRRVEMSVGLAYRQGQRYDTALYAIPVRATFGVGDWLDVDLQFVAAVGQTREISAGVSKLSADPDDGEIVQKLRTYGAQAVVDYRIDRRLMLTLETDWATGDDDPRTETDVEQCFFARDLNVGLLLFEHVLAYETARSARLGAAFLQTQDSESFPVTETATEGRLTNAIVWFPYLSYWPVETFLVRAGVLYARADEPVVDPVQSLLARDGRRIDDDAVNFNGGKPGMEYGTEFDLKLRWTFQRYFIWELESALLLPGDALKNEHDDAVPAWLVENRFTFVFGEVGEQ